MIGCLNKSDNTFQKSSGVFNLKRLAQKRTSAYTLSSLGTIDKRRWRSEKKKKRYVDMDPKTTRAGRAIFMASFGRDAHTRFLLVC